MSRKATKKDKRRIIFISIMIIGMVALLIHTCSSDCYDIYKNQQEIASLTTKYDDLLQEESELKSEVKKLQDPDYVARYARETYLYSLPGERIIKTE